jgi:hypothetical protein
MEVQAIDVDHVRSFLEGTLNFAVLPHTVPDSVRASFFVENAVIRESLFGINDRFKRFVFDLNEFSGILG